MFQADPTGIKLRSAVGYLAVEVLFINVDVVAIVFRECRQRGRYPEIHTGADKGRYFIVGFTFVECINIKRRRKRAGLTIDAEAIGQRQTANSAQAKAFQLAFNLVLAKVAEINVFGLQGKKRIELVADSGAKQIVFILELAAV